MKPKTPIHKRPNGSYPWTTAAEVGFLAKVSLPCLIGYAKSMEKRVEWGEIDSFVVKKFVIRRIRALDGKERKAKERKEETNGGSKDHRTDRKSVV